MKTLLCVITARGGSKRIPRKNIRDFCGKPAIAYSVQAALDTGIFSEVMVSTDDAEIAETAERFGAKIPFFRSFQNSDDFASTSDVILEVLKEYEKLNKIFDYVCCLYPVVPLLKKERIMEAWKMICEEDFDSVFPVMPFSAPIQRALKIDSDSRVRMFFPENINVRSQDLQKAYYDAGQFYLLKSDKFLAQKKIWTENTGCLVLNEFEAHDIDNEDDWKAAEYKYSYLRAQNK